MKRSDSKWGHFHQLLLRGTPKSLQEAKAYAAKMKLNLSLSDLLQLQQTKPITKGETDEPTNQSR